MFFDIFHDLCAQKGISCKRAAEEIGLSNSITTKWKKTGATPSGETLSRIAAYFGVSVGYLLGKETIKAPTLAPNFQESSGYWDGERLSELRGEYGLSEEQIASRLELSREAYRDLESGGAEPNFSLLLRLADTFTADLDFICHRTSRQNPAIGKSANREILVTAEEKHLIELYRIASEKDRKLVRMALEHYDESSAPTENVG